MGLKYNLLSNFVLRSCRAKLQAEISKLPQKPTVKQQYKVACMQACLVKQVKDFLHNSTIFLPTLEEVDLKPFKEEVIDTPAEEAMLPNNPVDGSLDEDFNYEIDEAEVSSVLPEVVVLPLPSNIISFKLKSSLDPLKSVEREL